MDYMKQLKEHEALTSQITDATQALAQMPRPPHDLEQRLATARASLAAEQKAFPGKMNSTQVINTILKLADECKVKAIPLMTQPWSVENAGKHRYWVFRLNVAVKGSFPQLASFISKLENGEFKTLIVEDLRVNLADEHSEGTISVTARLDLAIYARPLTSDQGA